MVDLVGTAFTADNKISQAITATIELCRTIVNSESLSALSGTYFLWQQAVPGKNRSNIARFMVY
jgi:hypothetical protein